MSVGRVFERAFLAIRHNLLATLGLTVLLGAIPAVAIQYVLSQVPSYALVMTVGSLVLPGFFALFLVQWFFGLVIGVLVQGALTRPVVAEQEGRKARLGEALAVASSRLFPLIPLGLLTGIVVIIGSTLLIVPGIIVYVLWSVAAPALADEREGLFMALSRSQELTEGARWKSFAIILILVAFSAVASILMSVLFLMLRGLLAEASFETWRLILLGFLSIVVNIVWGAVQASLFVELREWKEGGADLGEVFA